MSSSYMEGQFRFMVEDMRFKEAIIENMQSALERSGWHIVTWCSTYVGSHPEYGNGDVEENVLVAPGETLPGGRGFKHFDLDDIPEYEIWRNAIDALAEQGKAIEL